MISDPVYLSASFVLENESGIPCALEAALYKDGANLRRVEHVYAATILGDMSEEQEALTRPKVPFDLQPRFMEALKNAAGAPVTLIGAACVSGAAALTLAHARIAAGKNRRVAVIAVEQLSAFLINGFKALRCLTDTPAPYTRRRQGFRLAAGFGWAVLSSRPEGTCGIRLTAAASTNDAAHLTGPDQEGRGLLRAIECALEQAHLSPDNIDTIKLNGAGTGPGDASECRALQTCFGTRLQEIPCLCLKPVIGHMQGASGLVETIIAADCLHRQCLPGVPEGLMKNAEFPFSFSMEERNLPMKRMLLLYSGMGGQNAALILEREAS